MAIIRDPVNQQGGRVAADGRLAVGGWETAHEHIVSIEDGESFFVSSALGGIRFLTLPATAFPGVIPVLAIRNDSATETLVIEKLLISTKDADVRLVWTKNPTIGTIAAFDAAVPANTNFGSGKAADTTVWVWDETGSSGMTGFTAGTEFKSWHLVAGPMIFPIDGAINLLANNTLMISMGHTTAAEVETGLRFFFVPNV